MMHHSSHDFPFFSDYALKGGDGTLELNIYKYLEEDISFLLANAWCIGEGGWQLPTANPSLSTRSNASSTISLSLITFEPRRTPLVVKTKLGLQSKIRCDSASAENPANTTCSQKMQNPHLINNCVICKSWITKSGPGKTETCTE
jgi:hypothetical protein